MMISGPIAEIWQVVLARWKELGEITPYHKSRVLRHTLFKAPALIDNDLLALLELRDRGPHFSRYRSIIDLPHPAEEYLQRYTVGEKLMDDFLQIDRDFLAFGFRLGIDLSIKPIELRQFLSLMDETAKRDKQSCAEYLRKLNLESIIRRDDLNRNQKIIQVKTLTAQARYPEMAELRTRLESLAGRINSPVSAIWDKTFEKDVLQLFVEIKKPGDIDRAIASIVKAKETGLLQEMTDLLKG